MPYLANRGPARVWLLRVSAKVKVTTVEPAGTMAAGSERFPPAASSPP
ncbi:hypothetical protein [Pyxidicoccus parkwayensis]|nr:hypothetical protein [Pyxidicoccus parkwaysis]